MVIDERKVLKSIDSNIDIDKNGHCTIPFGVKEIGLCVFAHNPYLKSISIPNSVTKINAHAFASCDSLMYISLPTSVVEIGASAFQKCHNLKSVTGLDSVKLFLLMHLHIAKTSQL